MFLGKKKKQQNPHPVSPTSQQAAARHSFHLKPAPCSAYARGIADATRAAAPLPSPQSQLSPCPGGAGSPAHICPKLLTPGDTAQDSPPYWISTLVVFSQKFITLLFFFSFSLGTIYHVNLQFASSSHWRRWELGEYRQIWPKVAYSPPRRISILPWGIRVTFTVGIFNKLFPSEALAPSSEHITKHNALPCLPHWRHVWKSSEGERFDCRSWQGALSPMTDAQHVARAEHPQLMDRLAKRESKTAGWEARRFLPCQNPSEYWQGSATGKRHCPADSSISRTYEKGGDPSKQFGAYRKTAQEQNQDAPCGKCSLSLPYCSANQWMKCKSFVIRSQKAWPKTQWHWWACFHWFSGFIPLQSSHLRVRCSFWHWNA